MSKPIIRNSIWSVLFEGIKIYISNIDKFVLFMLFPVFGQLIGLALTFGLTIGLASKVGAKANNMTTAMIFIFLLALPGLLIFMKAFWDYMVAYVAQEVPVEIYNDFRFYSAKHLFLFIGRSIPNVSEHQFTI